MPRLCQPRRLAYMQTLPVQEPMSINVVVSRSTNVVRSETSYIKRSFKRLLQQERYFTLRSAAIVVKFALAASLRCPSPIQSSPPMVARATWLALRVVSNCRSLGLRTWTSGGMPLIIEEHGGFCCDLKNHQLPSEKTSISFCRGEGGEF